jgi:ATP-dependent helicase/nuclease subunit A
LSDEIIRQIEKGLKKIYPHGEATCTPSKQTATQRKGRVKDQEAAENAQEPKVIHRTWRRPSFVEQKVDAASYGTAIHTVLQYMDFKAGTDRNAIARGASSLQERGLLSQEQAQMVDCDKLAAFLETPLGKKVSSGENVLREFKFSILDDGAAVSENLRGEQILLQGVVDCAIVEEDGITVIDFKTDRIQAAKLEEALQRYRPQVQAYADALSRIFQRRVKRSCLYFFELNQFVDIE